MHQSRLTLIAALALANSSFGAVTQLNLSNYQIVGGFDLPSVTASEASAITYNWDNDHLFVVGDEGDALVELTRSGAVVSTMTLTGFDDTEGLTYIGSGKLLITEERLQNAYTLPYSAGGTVDRSSLQVFDFGPTVGNIGLEGLSFDQANNLVFGVKEKSVQLVYQASLNFTTGAATITNPFSPVGLGLLDLSDIQTLTGVTALLGEPAAGNLLIISQESGKIVEVDRTSGALFGSFDFSAVSTSVEGITIASDGIIYLADESPHVTILSAVPEPPTVGAILGIGLGILGLIRSSRRGRCTKSS